MVPGALVLFLFSAPGCVTRPDGTGEGKPVEPPPLSPSEGNANKPPKPKVVLKDPRDASNYERLSEVIQLISTHYVDPKRVNPYDMFLAALDRIEHTVPEAMVELNPTADSVKVSIGTVSRTFDLRGLDQLWEVTIALRNVFRFFQTHSSNGHEDIEHAANVLRRTRPTAKNLFWAIDRMLKKANEGAGGVEEIKKSLVEEALKIAKEDEDGNRRIGEYGEQFIEDGDVILTICNAGSLATYYYGTALAPIYRAWEKGKRIKVIALETRPYLQGARLTAFELKQAGIPVKIATDNSMGFILSKGVVDKVFVGADRITLTGHVVNKIGTYTLAVVAKRHNIPFYVCAPTSTIDPDTPIEKVEIEQRPSEEVTVINGFRIAPEGVEAIYYAFDITPPELVTAIITEKGVVHPPFNKSIPRLLTS